MRSRRARSQFTALSDAQRTNVREAAVTMAQQGLRRPMVTGTDAERRGATGGGIPNDPGHRGGGIPNDPGHHPHHADQHHRPGNTDGTYNSSHAGGTEGSTDPNTGGGVDLMARVILNQSKHPSGPGRPVSTQKPPPWPGAGNRGQDSGPLMPRRKRA